MYTRIGLRLLFSNFHHKLNMLLQVSQRRHLSEEIIHIQRGHWKADNNGDKVVVGAIGSSCPLRPHVGFRGTSRTGQTTHYN